MTGTWNLVCSLASNHRVRYICILLTGIFLASFFLGALVAGVKSENVAQNVEQEYTAIETTIENATGANIPEYKPLEIPSIFLVFINNMIVVLIGFVASIYIGKEFPAIVVMFQGAGLGIIVGTYLKVYNALFVASAAIPGGVLESGIIIVACALGYYYSENRDKVDFNDVIKIINVFIILIFAAAIAEVFISPVFQYIVGTYYGAFA